MDKSELHFFDRKQEFSVTWKSLPHWSQAGAVCFMTWRTNDSLPAPITRRLFAERCNILRKFGFDPDSDWKTQLQRKPAGQRAQLHWQLFDSRDQALDIGHGECLLKHSDLANIVAESLLHFDGDRYFVTDFVIMPNHIHLLAAFRDEEVLLQQSASWKRYTARKINKKLGRSGEFWQVEEFDHLVRDSDWFDYYRHYIAENGPHAGLRADEFHHWTRAL